MSTLQEHFETKFTKADSCWNWAAGKDKDGYGTFCHARRNHRAHRLAYQLYVGEIPEGLSCLHHCDNPSCVNPNHLFLGTSKDNNQDRSNKGRNIDNAGEKHWNAKLTAVQVLEIRERRKAGARCVDLAKEFSVSKAAISDIVHHRKWAKL